MTRALKSKTIERLKWWYVGQLVVVLLTVFGTLIWQSVFEHQTILPRQIMVSLIIVAVVLLSLKIPFEKPLKPQQRIALFFRKVNYYFQSLLQALVLPIGGAMLISLIHNIFRISFVYLAIIGFLYLLVLYIPMTYFVYAQIESLVGRIILLAEILAQGIMAGSQLLLMYTRPDQVGHLIQTMNETQVINVASVVVTISFLMFLWGF
ncbi:hypothetical protein ACLJJ6_08495 [Pediococcus siamensis]|uniref:hypothetical protein n=1 Tax=Pediococcus siamensis TaxID=381829 RepID=UPI0039A22B76